MTYFYLAELRKNDDKELLTDVKQEISLNERDEINNIFSFVGLHNQITEMYRIVLENGLDFQNWMRTNFQNLIKEKKMKYEDIITNSNRLVLNYASSIKTFLEIEEKLLHKYPRKKEKYKNSTHDFYDKYMEYRFWYHLRNFVVHYSLPYTAFTAEEKTPARIVCYKKHLLRYSGWKQCKVDIEKMEDEIDLVPLTETMNCLITALYLEFYTLFAEEITSSITQYGNLCRKYDVERPVIISTFNHDDFSHGQIQPLYIEKLKEAFELLKENPKIDIAIK